MDPRNDVQGTSESGDRWVTAVPLVQQYYNWDCGLACVSMVLSFFGVSAADVYTKDLDFLQCGESIWTIDLAYILLHYGISHCLYTITLGANSDYASKITARIYDPSISDFILHTYQQITFYRRSFDKDEERINKMFREAISHGVQIEKRSLCLDFILSHLSRGNIAIVLIDWRFLECIWCDSRLKRACICCLELCKTPYQGHFIVVCGFDRKKRFIFYKNPNTHKEDMCCTRFEPFEKARKAHGTDEDILFVYPK